MESQILTSTGPVTVNPNAWQTASFGVLASMENVETANGAKLTAMSASLSDRLVTEAVLAGLPEQFRSPLKSVAGARGGVRTRVGDRIAEIRRLLPPWPCMRLTSLLKT